MRRPTKGPRAILALILTAVMLITAAPAMGAGNEQTGGSGVNRSGGGSSVGGGANQDVMVGDVPWCVSSTNQGGFWAPRPTRNNNYFLAPFPGCEGHDWTVAMRNCFTGYMVWRFYGTLGDNGAAQVVTRSRVEVPRWCASGSDQIASFFFPNGTDATGQVASSVDGTKADFAYHIWGSIYNHRTIVQTSDSTNTTGVSKLLKGNCTQPLTNLPNWFRTSVSNNPDAARKKLYERFRATTAATGSAETGRLDINAVTVPNSPGGIRFGSIDDCSSIYDYQGYLDPKSAQSQSEAFIRNNTVVVGTCAIPLERPARVYTGGQYAYWTDEILDGKLGERYSMAKFPYGLADDAVTRQYKNAVKSDAFSDSSMPMSPRAWPSAERIGSLGSSAWNRPETKDRDLLAKYVRCDYQSLAPQTDLIGCEYTTAGCIKRDSTTEVRIKDSDQNSDVYVEVSATLPRYYTASGDLKVYRVPSTGKVLCKGRTCGTERLDPRIISWTYSTKLVGEGGYRACKSKRERNCDWFSDVAGKNGTLTGTFYSPTAKGERVRLVVADAAVTFARRVEREIERCETITTTDERTGEKESDIVCYTEIIIEELPPETVNASVLLPKDSARTVTGSVGS
jgi:hypothetical protein